MERRRSTKFLIPALAVAMAAAACGGSGDDEGGSADGGEIIYGEGTAFPENLFPLIAAGNSTSIGYLETNILPSTFRTQPDLTVQYDDELLTAEPTNEMVNGKQTITYKLNPDAQWSDGDPIALDDFQYIWNILKSSDPAEGGCPAILSTVGYEQVESVEQGEDENTIVVTYAAPYPDWKSLFDLLPAHLLDQGDPAANCDVITEGWPTAEGIVGGVSGGPWQLTKDGIDVANQVFVLTPNENYWGEQPQLDRLIHQTIGNEPGTLVKAMESGEVDLVYPQPQLDLLQQVKDLEPEVTSQLEFGLSYEQLNFNTTKPHIEHAEIRQAVALAIDRQSLVEGTIGQFDSRAQVLNSRMYVNNQPTYEDNAPEQYKSQNVDAAKTLIESIGYTMGDDGFYRSPDGEVLELEFMTTQQNPLRENTLKLVIDMIKDAGIKGTMNLNPDIFAGADKPTSLEAGGFEVALFAWVSAPFVTGRVAIYHSVSGDSLGQNYTRGGTTEIDAALEEMARTADAEGVAALANKADTLMWEQMYTIPLYQRVNMIAYDSGYEGIQINPTVAGPTWNSYEWAVKQ